MLDLPLWAWVWWVSLLVFLSNIFPLYYDCYSRFHKIFCITHGHLVDTKPPRSCRRTRDWLCLVSFECVWSYLDATSTSTTRRCRSETKSKNSPHLASTYTLCPRSRYDSVPASSWMEYHSSMTHARIQFWDGSSPFHRYTLPLRSPTSKTLFHHSRIFHRRPECNGCGDWAYELKITELF